MPCSSEYLNPNQREQEFQRAAQLLIYVRTQLNKDISLGLEQAAKDIYCRIDFVPDLCSVIKDMTEEQLNSIVYNAKSSVSRNLANWWEEHQAADAAREKKEKEYAERRRIQREVLAKMTEEERKAFGF